MAYPGQAVDIPSNPPNDEISLRELYLIVRRGFAGIVVFSLLIGAVAFVYTTTRPVIYRAAASVQVVPPQLSSQTLGADQVPQVSLNAQAYTLLARSNDVVADALGVASDPADATLREFLESAEVRATDASSQARPSVNAEHAVTAPIAVLAAERANAWADASTTAAVAALRSPLDAAYVAATEEFTTREAELAAAEAAWAAFASDDARAQLTQRLEGLATIEAETDGQRVLLDRLIASTAAQRDLLASVVSAREGGDASALADQLRALFDAGALDVESDAALRQALASSGASAGPGVPAEEVVTLVAKTRLDTLTAELAGYVAERDQLTAGRAQLDAEAASLRTRLAELERQAAGLQRALTTAQAAHERLSALIPVLESQRSLAQGAARVVVRATPAVEPEPRNRVVVTLAAAVVAGLLATLFVFLREAVREPATAAATARRTADGRGADRNVVAGGSVDDEAVSGRSADRG